MPRLNAAQRSFKRVGLYPVRPAMHYQQYYSRRFRVQFFAPHGPIERFTLHAQCLWHDDAAGSPYLNLVLSTAHEDIILHTLAHDFRDQVSFDFDITSVITPSAAYLAAHTFHD